MMCVLTGDMHKCWHCWGCLTQLQAASVASKVAKPAAQSASKASVGAPIEAPVEASHFGDAVGSVQRSRHQCYV